MRVNPRQSMVDSALFKARAFHYILWIFVLSVLSSCDKPPNPKESSQPRRSSTPHPPDLTRCTQMEIRYKPSTMNYFLPGRDERALLSEAEPQQVKSLETIVVDDANGLKAFAQVVSQGQPHEVRGLLGTNTFVNVACYDHTRLLASFTVFRNSIVTKEDDWFIYPRTMDLEERICELTSQMRAYRLRLKCRANLAQLQLALSRLRSQQPDRFGLSKWCDSVARYYQALGRPEEWLASVFKCPAASTGRCHYAINTNWTPESSGDMVSLFETTDGWNQRGGPESFSFDNHDPRGGCVQLNNGTVKFIHTEEELRQLRKRETRDSQLY